MVRKLYKPLTASLYHGTIRETVFKTTSPTHQGNNIFIKIYSVSRNKGKHEKVMAKILALKWYYL